MKKAMSFYNPEKEKTALKEFAKIHDLSQTDVIRLGLKSLIDREFKPGVCPICGSTKGEIHEH